MGKMDLKTSGFQSSDWDTVSKRGEVQDASTLAKVGKRQQLNVREISFLGGLEVV